MKKTLTFLLILFLSITNIFPSNYFKDKLRSKDKELYTIILSAIKNEEEYVDIDIQYSNDEIKMVFDYVFKDNPQIFYANQKLMYEWVENNKSQKISSRIRFSYKKYNESISEVKKKIDNIIASYTLILNKLDSPYDQIKVLYKYFALNINYDLSQKNDQSAYSVLINNRGVCASYSRAFQYIMISLDIPCIFITGELNGTPHAWNMVKIDNLWYHIDITNGNNGYDDYCNYEYFLLPTTIMEKSVKIDFDINNPIAISDKYNYFKNNSLYFSSFDKNIINNRISKNVNNKKNGITLNFKKTSDLLEAKEYLINKQNIYSLISSNSISYVVNEKRNLLIIHF